MNRYHPSTGTPRTALATLAFVATFLTLGSIGGLVDHYAGTPSSSDPRALPIAEPQPAATAARVR